VVLTPTPTQTITPTQSEATANALLIIEPVSLASAIGTHMNSVGATSFFGWSNGLGPDNTSDLVKYLEMYANNSVSGLTAEVTSTIPQSGATQYLFDEIIINQGTVNENAWYTFFIPQSSIGGSNNRMTQLEQGTSSSYGTVITLNPTYYDLGLVSFGGTDYRCYTSFTSQSLRLNNTSTSLYFRGKTVV
jgi:hypothetical protein